MKVTVDDLVQVRSVLVCLEDMTGFETIVDTLSKETLYYATSNCINALAEILGPEYTEKKLRSVGSSSRDSAGDFQIFSRKLLVGVMSEKYSITDQAMINKENNLPFDLVFVNFGEKRFENFSREDVGAYNLMVSAAYNFSRVMVLSDSHDYPFFVKKVKTNAEIIAANNYFPGDNGSNIATDIKTRFQAAQKVISSAKMLIASFPELDENYLEDKFDLFVKSEILGKKTLQKNRISREAEIIGGMLGASV